MADSTEPNDSNEATTTDTTNTDTTTKKRRIVVSKEANMIVNAGSDNEVHKVVSRNRVAMFKAIKELEDTDTVTIIEVEDEALSDQPNEGEERKTLTIVDNKVKEEALKTVGAQVLPEGAAVAELFKLLDILSITSTLNVAGFALVFNEDTVGHFAFENPNSTIEDKTVEACINTLNNLADEYTKEAKSKRPLLNVGNNRIIVP
jgi:hypothetical protein